MNRLFITVDEHDFIVFDLESNSIVHRQKQSKELDAPELKGKGRPTYRPFGIDFDDDCLDD